MRLATRRGVAESDASNGLVDVVFLLLIYFMCTASFAAIERDLPAELPAGGQTAAPRDPDLERLLIRVLADGAFECNGTLCADAAALRARLRSLRALADVPVIVDGDGALPFHAVIAGLDAARAAGYRRVALAGAAP